MTVERVEHIGKPIGKHGVERVQIRQFGAESTTAIVDQDTLRHARLAISVSRRAYGSIMGRLDVLNARTKVGLRAQVLIEETRRAVTVRAAPDQADLLRAAWGQRVLVGGELKRNSVGQPVKLDLTELRILQERDQTSAWDILGIAPAWTGDMTTEEFIRQARRG